MNPFTEARKVLLAFDYAHKLRAKGNHHILVRELLYWIEHSKTIHHGGGWGPVHIEFLFQGARNALQEDRT